MVDLRWASTPADLARKCEKDLLPLVYKLLDQWRGGLSNGKGITGIRSEVVVCPQCVAEGSGEEAMFSVAECEEVMSLLIV